MDKKLLKKNRRNKKRAKSKSTRLNKQYDFSLFKMFLTGPGKGDIGRVFDDTETKVEQSEEAKQLALAQAEAKRSRKAEKKAKLLEKSKSN